MIDRETLLEFTEYDPETGVFRWRKSTGSKSVVGKQIGSSHSEGYFEARIAGKRCFLHRAAWLYMTGEWPKEIDHINGDRSDNRWSNLRLASRQQNSANQKLKKTNTSGLKGVHRNSRGRWIASIHFDYKTRYLGSFDNKEEAHAAYMAAAQQYHGEFARAA
jgi:hypothetical protein